MLVFRDLVGLSASVYGRLVVSGFSVYPEDGAWVHRYLGPRYRVHDKIHLPKKIPKGNRDSDLLAVNLYHKAPEELGELIQDVCQYVPKPGDNVVDVGAGTGTSTAVLSHFVGPGGRVMAIEAHPRQFRCLEKTCQLNQLSNVILVGKAVSDSLMELVIRDGDDLNASVTSEKGLGFRVQGTTLDQLFREHGFETIDLITMNIEGAETLAIQGMSESINRIRHVAIACHDFRANSENNDFMRTSAFVTAFLKEHGFEITKEGSSEYGAASGDWIAARNKSL